MSEPLEVKADSEEGKKCVWQVLYGKAERPQCQVCRNYNENCREYIPMVESQAERVARIHRQLNLKYI